MSTAIGPRDDPERVVILNDRSVALGGATGLALLSLELLRRRGIPVTFLTGDDGANPLFARLDVPVVALGEAKLLDAGPLAAGTRGLYNPRTVSVLGAWIAANDRPGTVYHLHTWSQILSPSVFRALEPVRERLLVTAHDFFLTCPNGAYALFKAGRPCPLVPLSLACLRTDCDRRSYVHKTWRVARQAVQSRTLRYHDGSPRVLVIHPAMAPLLERGGVPRDAIQALANPVRPWSPARIEAERNAEFVFVGRLNEEKGPDLAARAARRAGVRLRVVGDGPLLGALKESHPEVVFEGRQPPETIARIVASARALVMPSRYPEPYGLVVGEALWSGLPVILTDQALLAADVVALGAGIACDPRDEAALAAALSLLAQNDDVTHAISVNAFTKTAALGHTPAAWADALLAAYREAIAACATPASDRRAGRGTEIPRRAALFPRP